MCPGSGDRVDVHAHTRENKNMDARTRTHTRMHVHSHTHTQRTHALATQATCATHAHTQTRTHANLHTHMHVHYASTTIQRPYKREATSQHATYLNEANMAGKTPTLENQGLPEHTREPGATRAHTREPGATRAIHLLPEHYTSKLRFPPEDVEDLEPRAILVVFFEVLEAVDICIGRDLHHAFRHQLVRQ